MSFRFLVCLLTERAGSGRETGSVLSADLFAVILPLFEAAQASKSPVRVETQSVVPRVRLVSYSQGD